MEPRDGLVRTLSRLEQEFGVAQRFERVGSRLADLIETLHDRTGQRVVVLVDEYDKPILDNLTESERAVRPTVLGRPNYQGSRSRRGTEVHAILSTMVESAKRCEVPPEAYLQAAAENALR